MRIHFDIHSRQHITLMVCLIVVLKATEGREAHKTGAPNVNFWKISVRKMI